MDFFKILETYFQNQFDFESQLLQLVSFLVPLLTTQNHTQQSFETAKLLVVSVQMIEQQMVFNNQILQLVSSLVSSLIPNLPLQSTMNTEPDNYVSCTKSEVHHSALAPRRKSLKKKKRTSVFIHGCSVFSLLSQEKVATVLFSSSQAMAMTAIVPQTVYEREGVVVAKSDSPSVFSSVAVPETEHQSSVTEQSSILSLGSAGAAYQVAPMASSRQPPIIDDGFVEKKNQKKKKESLHDGLAFVNPRLFSGAFNTPVQVGVFFGVYTSLSIAAESILIDGFNLQSVGEGQHSSKDILSHDSRCTAAFSVYTLSAQRRGKTWVYTRVFSVPAVKTVGHPRYYFKYHAGVTFSLVPLKLIFSPTVTQIGSSNGPALKSRAREFLVYCNTLFGPLSIFKELVNFQRSTYPSFIYCGFSFPIGPFKNQTPLGPSNLSFTVLGLLAPAGHLLGFLVFIYSQSLGFILVLEINKNFLWAQKFNYPGPFIFKPGLSIFQNGPTAFNESLPSLLCKPTFSFVCGPSPPESHTFICSLNLPHDKLIELLSPMSFPTKN